MSGQGVPARLAEQGYRALLRLTDWISYLILAVMAAIVCIDVLSRYLFGVSTQIAEEVASLGLVALIFFSLLGAFHDNAVLRVDALYRLIPLPLRRPVDIAFHLTAIGVTLVYVIYVGRLALNSFRAGIVSDTALGTPNYLPQAAMALGLCGLLMAILAGLVRLLTRGGERRHDGAP